MAARLSTGNVSLLEQEYDQQVQALLESLQKHSVEPAAQRTLKNHVSNMYSVFVQAIGKAAEQQHAINRNVELIRSLTQSNNDAVAFRTAAESRLTEQMNRLQGMVDAGQPAEGAAVAAEIRATLQQVEDSSVWQRRIHRMAEENEQLYDKIASLQGELMDTQFSNQSLKTELCGRIQQLQLMSKGMASAGDKMYQRVLHEMEQNSMKAYAQHGRKVSSTPGAAATPAAKGGPQRASRPQSAPAKRSATRQTASPGGSPARVKASAAGKAPKYKRSVRLQKTAAGGLGLRISGGVIDGVQHPVLIQGVEPGKPAAACGQIFAGDWIVEACGTNTAGLDHAGLVALLRAAGQDVDFVVLSNSIPKVPTVVTMAAIEGFSPADVGRRVLHESGVEGTLRFVGVHAMPRKGARVGIELSQPAGKNNGTIEGNRYFECADGHGLLCVPSKIMFAPAPAPVPASAPAPGTPVTAVAPAPAPATAPAPAPAPATPVTAVPEPPSLAELIAGKEVELDAANAAKDRKLAKKMMEELEELEAQLAAFEVYDAASGGPATDVEVQAITSAMEQRRNTDGGGTPRAGPTDAAQLRLRVRGSDGAYSPKPDSKFSMGIGMDVAAVQQSSLREDTSGGTSLFSTM